MVLWKLKSCPRCGGDMFIERDGNIWFEHCLMCSYRSELKSLEKKGESPLAVAPPEEAPRETGELEGDLGD